MLIFTSQEIQIIGSAILLFLHVYTVLLRVVAVMEKHHASNGHGAHRQSWVALFPNAVLARGPSPIHPAHVSHTVDPWGETPCSGHPCQMIPPP